MRHGYIDAALIFLTHLLRYKNSKSMEPWWDDKEWLEGSHCWDLFTPNFVDLQKRYLPLLMQSISQTQVFPDNLVVIILMFCTPKLRVFMNADNRICYQKLYSLVMTIK